MKTKQINQFNSRGNREGYWEGYFKNGQLCWKGHYVNGNREGYWEGYYANGQLLYKVHYVRGEEIRGIFFKKNLQN